MKHLITCLIVLLFAVPSWAQVTQRAVLDTTSGLDFLNTAGDGVGEHLEFRTKPSPPGGTNPDLTCNGALNYWTISGNHGAYHALVAQITAIAAKGGQVFVITGVCDGTVTGHYVINIKLVP